LDSIPKFEVPFFHYKEIWAFRVLMKNITFYFTVKKTLCTHENANFLVAWHYKCQLSQHRIYENQVLLNQFLSLQVFHVLVQYSIISFTWICNDSWMWSVIHYNSLVFQVEISGTNVIVKAHPEVDTYINLCFFSINI
jgi:hypothetical protein